MLSAISTTATALIDRALLLNPNLAWAWLFSGWVRVWLRRSRRRRIERVTRAMRLSPNDPHIFDMHTAHRMRSFYCRSLRRGSVMGRSGGAGAAELMPCNAYLARKPMPWRGGRSRRRRPWRMCVELDPALRLSNLRDLLPDPATGGLCQDGKRACDWPACRNDCGMASAPPSSVSSVSHSPLRSNNNS